MVTMVWLRNLALEDLVMEEPGQTARVVGPGETFEVDGRTAAVLLQVANVERAEPELPRAVVVAAPARRRIVGLRTAVR